MNDLIKIVSQFHRPISYTFRKKLTVKERYGRAGLGWTGSLFLNYSAGHLKIITRFFFSIFLKTLKGFRVV